MRRFAQDADTTRIAVGLDGSFNLANRLWSWDLDIVHGRYQIAKSTIGLLDLSRLGRALGPSFRDTNGVARCGTAAAVIADCVPFDPFRGPAALTPEMLDDVYYRGRDDTQTRAASYHFGIAGDLYDLPAGQLAFAAGYEHRREEGSSRIDARRAALENLANANFGGELSVGEAYLELALPLLADAPAAQLLELSLAGRRSDYDSFGVSNTFEGGLTWKPFEQLLVRASFSEGLRAPIVSELFFPAATSLAGIDAFDPCSAISQPTPAERENCIADGVPGGVYTPEGVLFDVTSGGNPDLQPESATSRTIGAVWSPPWLPGFDLSLDWYRIEIDDAIAPVDAEALLRNCISSAIAEACDRTFRDSSGELLQVDARLLNSGVLEVEGYDLTAGYRIDTAVGHLEMRWDSTYYKKYRFEVPRGSGERSNVGQLAAFEPGFRLRSNLDLGWQRDAWDAAVGIRYYSHLDEACRTATFAGAAHLCSSPAIASPAFAGLPENRLASRTYVDLQAGWNTPWAMRIVVGVHNAFDRDPPVSYSAVSNSFDPAYPVPGRFWYAQVSAEF